MEPESGASATAERRSRFVIKFADGMPGEEGEAKVAKGGVTALKVFKYEDPLDFIAEFAPLELDTLFGFECKYLLAGRSIRQLSPGTLLKLAPPPRAAAPKGSTSPRRSPQERGLKGRRPRHL